MRKIDEIAAQQFDGDTFAVIDHYVQNKKCLDELVDDFTKEESQHAFNLLVDWYADGYCGGLDNMQTLISFEMKVQGLGISEEEMENAVVNPFKRDTLKALIRLLLSIFIPTVVYAIIRQFTDDTSWIFAVQSVLIGLFSINLSTALLNMHRFRKLKKQLPKINAIRELAKKNDAE